MGAGQDKGANSPSRLRRQLQHNAVGQGIEYGDGLVYDADNGTLGLGLATDPALDFVGGSLTLLIADDSGLSKDSDGLTIDLRDTTPGLELVASGLGVLLDPSEPGLQLTTGLKVLLASNSGLALSSGLTINDEIPKWRKYTIAFGDLATAATTNDIELLSLPARGIIHSVKIKHSASFTGGTISAYTISVGIVGTLNKYATAFDVFQAAGDTVFQVSSVVDGEDHGSAASIRIAAISTGDDLDQAAAGSVDVWVLYSVPAA